MIYYLILINTNNKTNRLRRGNAGPPVRGEPMSRIVRKLLTDELEVASGLVWHVFMRVEAPEQSPRGVETFRQFILPANLRRAALCGTSRFFGCFEEDRLLGVIADRGWGYVSLLFVDEAYHRQGIARTLMGRLKEETLAARPGLRRMTVNASPYAVEAYRRMGFTLLSGEQQRGGLRFFPMELLLVKRPPDREQDYS